MKMMLRWQKKNNFCKFVFVNIDYGIYFLNMRAFIKNLMTGPLEICWEINDCFTQA